MAVTTRTDCVALTPPKPAMREGIQTVAISDVARALWRRGECRHGRGLLRAVTRAQQLPAGQLVSGDTVLGCAPCRGRSNTKRRFSVETTGTSWGANSSVNIICGRPCSGGCGPFCQGLVNHLSRAARPLARAWRKEINRGICTVRNNRIKLTRNTRIGGHEITTSTFMSAVREHHPHPMMRPLVTVARFVFRTRWSTPNRTICPSDESGEGCLAHPADVALPAKRDSGQPDKNRVRQQTTVITPPRTPNPTGRLCSDSKIRPS